MRHLTTKGESKSETPDVEVELRRLKAEEKKKRLIPMRMDSKTIILVDKDKASPDRIENFKNLNEMFRKKYP